MESGYVLRSEGDRNEEGRAANWLRCSKDGTLSEKKVGGLGTLISGCLHLILAFNRSRLHYAASSDPDVREANSYSLFVLQTPSKSCFFFRSLRAEHSLGTKAAAARRPGLAEPRSGASASTRPLSRQSYRDSL